MKLHFSTLTLQAYENNDGLMDLFFNPIIIFEETSLEEIEALKDIKITVSAKELDGVELVIQAINDPLIKTQKGVYCIEFRCVNRDIAFIKKNYICNLRFTAYLEERLIEYTALGVVKTKYSKGLI